TSEQRGLVFNSAERRNVDSTLQVGATNQSVVVQASAEAVIAVDTGEKSSVLTTQTLQDIAVVGRSAAEFIKVLPGFAQAGNGTTNYPGYDGQVVGINGNGNAGRQSALGYFSANGTPLNSTEIVSDGAHVADPGCNCATPVNPNADMIQEMKVLQSNFSAENSKGPVVISSITKAGGTAYHGEGYMSARHFAMNAADWLDNKNNKGKKPENVYYFPGGNVGGPVLIPGTDFNKNRDKLFFFAGFEYFYQHLNSSQIQSIVPTEAMRNGDFSPASVAALGPARPVQNPVTAYPGGLIPKSAIDPGGMALMKLYPSPNADPFTTGGFNYIQNVLFSQNGSQAVGRVDYSVSDNTKLFVRYYHQQEVQNFPIQLWGQSTNQVPYPSGVTANNHSESMTVDLTRVFSPTLTNEFVGSYTYIGFPNTLSDPDAVDRTKIGYPYHGFFNNGVKLIPNISGSNNQVGTLSNQGAWGSNLSSVYYANKPMASLADNLAKSWGTHTIKVGVYAEYIANFQPASSAQQGTLTFDSTSPSSTGNAYGDMLTGRVFGFSQQNFNNVNRLEARLYEAYAQDSWKIFKNFSVDYGMRFQHIGQWTDRYHNGFAVWNPSTYTNDPTAILPGLAWNKIDPKVPNAGFPTRTMFFAPRFGMSYDIFGTGKTVIRGGIGAFRYRGPQSGTGSSAATGSYSQSLTTSTGTTLAAIDANPAPPRSTYQTGQSLVNRDDDQNPLTWSYNFTISQKVPGNSLFEVAYVGNMVRHILLAGYSNINAVPYGTLFSQANPNSVNYNLFRPFPAYADLFVVNHDGYSNYNALQVGLNHQSSRYTWLINYSFSKVLGAGTSGTTIDQLTLNNNYGPLQFDRRHIFNAAYSFNLGKPVRGRALGMALNNWQISGIAQIQSGVALQVNSTNGNFGMTLPSGVTARNINGTNSVPAMPVLTCDPRSNLGENQYINSACFSLPSPGRNGPIIQPQTYGPWFYNTDASLFKDIPISEYQKLQFRFETFNFLNHANYTFGQDSNLNLTFDAAGKVSNPLFGRATNKIGHRIIQLAIKYYF
ncbi:MAG: carboxypeptidase regulatory-like domain-containing protein, partial [Acidobacteriota bacterium]|nr:carboxypeptidase regulatory-like domain-containing protein [Acidobacteriota bacterium]